MTGFTPISAAIGGAMIAISLSIMLLSTGRVTGASGGLGRALQPRRADWGWHVSFVIGLLLAGAIARLGWPDAFDAQTESSLPVIAIAGVLVGVGTRLANGCTSGHGVCGISRGAPRSFAATVTFFGIAVVVATATGGAS